MSLKAYFDNILVGNEISIPNNSININAIIGTSGTGDNVLLNNGTFNKVNNNVITDNTISGSKIVDASTSTSKIIGISPGNSGTNYLNDKGQFINVSGFNNAFSNNVNANNYKINNLSDPVNLQDAATKNWIQNIVFQSINTYLSNNSIQIQKFLFTGDGTKALFDNGTFKTINSNNYTMPNNDIILNYQLGVNNVYTLQDHTNNNLYNAYLVHGYGNDNNPWVVMLSCNQQGLGYNYGQSDGSNSVYTVSISQPSTLTGNNIYASFDNYKGAVQMCLATESLTNTNANAFVAYNLVMDTDWNTKNYSLKYVLQKNRDYLASLGTNISNNDSIFNTPSTFNITSHYSGNRYSGNLQLNRSQPDGQSLNYLFIYGISYTSDNDTSVLAFCNALGYSNNWGDQWRGYDQLGTKWSYWNNDFHSNSSIQNLGVSQQKYSGYINQEFGINNSTNAWILIR